MQVKKAENLARDDFAAIREAIDAHDHAPSLAEHGRSLLVDGSMYSPSWRALSGGNTVWTVASVMGDEDETEAATEAYVETLDRLTDDFGGPGGTFLLWDDGCLFLALGEQD